MFVAGLYFTLQILAGPIWFAGRNWDMHVMVFTGIITIIGWQILTLGITAKIFAYHSGLENDSFNKKLSDMISLEKALILGLIFILIGIVFVLYILYAWYRAGFGDLKQIKTGMVALVMMAAGLQTILGGNITLYTKLCEQTREHSFDLMLAHASEMGANAVIGMRYDTTEIMQGVTELPRHCGCR